MSTVSPNLPNILDEILHMQPVILLGMHRSGTSLTTRLLVDVGFHMGHWLSRDAEAVFFQRINRRIYSSVNAKWGQVDALVKAMKSEHFIEDQVQAVSDILRNDQFHLKLNAGGYRLYDSDLWKKTALPGPDLWGWKDPRTTITFPIWLQLFPNARIVHVIRNGIDVAISTHRRSLKQMRKLRNRLYPLDYSPSTLNFAYCFHLWETYVDFVLEQRHIIPENNYFEMRFEDLLEKPANTMRSLLTFLDHSVPEDQLSRICQQIDSSRLDNTQYMTTYAADINKLVDSPIMERYGYSYNL